MSVHMGTRERRERRRHGVNVLAAAGCPRIHLRHRALGRLPLATLPCRTARSPRSPNITLHVLGDVVEQLLEDEKARPFGVPVPPTLRVLLALGVQMRRVRQPRVEELDY